MATGTGARRVRAIGQPVIDGTGSVLAVRGAVQDISGHDHIEFALSAAQDQLSDVERLVDEQQQLAIRLQHAIIAPAPPHASSCPACRSSCATGRPATSTWSAATGTTRWRCRPARSLLVVGDIAGHGIDVVTGMISMRNALRGLAMTGAPPARTVALAQRGRVRAAGPVIGTVVCAQYDPRTCTLRWARAGHLPPMLVRDGAAQLLPLAGAVRCWASCRRRVRGHRHRTALG